MGGIIPLTPTTGKIIMMKKTLLCLCAALLFTCAAADVVHAQTLAPAAPAATVAADTADCPCAHAAPRVRVQPCCAPCGYPVAPCASPCGYSTYPYYPAVAYPYYPVVHRVLYGPRWYYPAYYGYPYGYYW